MKKNECITLRDNTGAIINLWFSAAEAAKALGVSTQTIYNILQGRVKHSLKIQGHLSLEDLEPQLSPEEQFINLEGEEWKPINGFEDYEISNYGRIRKDFKLKQINASDGYLKTSLTKNGEKQYVYMHRLVAEHFLPDWDPQLVVNHKDENKQNNHVSNLKMMTLGENVAYSAALHKDTWGKSPKGQNRKVRCIETGIVYNSLTEAAKALGINYTNSIIKCCKGKYETAHGFHWEYVE